MVRKCNNTGGVNPGMEVNPSPETSREHVVFVQLRWPTIKRLLLNLSAGTNPKTNGRVRRTPVAFQLGWADAKPLNQPALCLRLETHYNFSILKSHVGKAQLELHI